MIIKNVNQQNKHCTTHPVNKHLSNLFTATKCTTIIELDENILKTFIQRNILPIDRHKKTKTKK